LVIYKMKVASWLVITLMITSFYTSYKQDEERLKYRSTSFFLLSEYLVLSLSYESSVLYVVRRLMVCNNNVLFKDSVLTLY